MDAILVLSFLAASGWMLAISLGISFMRSHKQLDAELEKRVLVLKDAKEMVEYATAAMTRVNNTNRDLNETLARLSDSVTSK